MHDARKGGRTAQLSRPSGMSVACVTSPLYSMINTFSLGSSAPCSTSCRCVKARLPVLSSTAKWYKTYRGAPWGRSCRVQLPIREGHAGAPPRQIHISCMQTPLHILLRRLC